MTELHIESEVDFSVDIVEDIYNYLLKQYKQNQIKILQVSLSIKYMSEQNVDFAIEQYDGLLASIDFKLHFARRKRLYIFEKNQKLKKDCIIL
eukprot:346927_1